MENRDRHSKRKRTEDDNDSSPPPKKANKESDTLNQLNNRNKKSKNQSFTKNSSNVNNSISNKPGHSSKSLNPLKRKRQEESELEDPQNKKHDDTPFSNKNFGSLISKQKEPIFITNILCAIRDSLIGKYTRRFTVFNPSTIQKTVVLVIEDMSKDFIRDIIDGMGAITYIFSSKQLTILDNVPLPTEIRNIYKFPKRKLPKEAFSSIFPADKNIKIADEKDTGTTSKLHLLLRPLQLLAERYPLPKDRFPFSKSENFKYTQEKYSPVSSKSPLYALDCEFFHTRSKNDKDLRWMALVNEKLETACQHEFGRAPSNENEKQNNLTEVQNSMKNLLSTNAILCGQSLNYDLNVLKVIHPYVIDTSVIYQKGENKDSLKDLAKHHLGMTIQSSKRHSPIEDSIATMKLVQLKLAGGFKSGNSNISQNAATSTKKSSSAISTSSVKSQSSSIRTEELLPQQHSLFKLINRFEKRVSIIADDETLEYYDEEFIPDHARKIEVEDYDEAVKEIMHCLHDTDMVIAHLDFRSTDYSLISSTIQDLFDRLPLNTMLMAIIAEEVDKTEFFKKGLFMKKLK